LSGWKDKILHAMSVWEPIPISPWHMLPQGLLIWLTFSESHFQFHIVP
jgi:hypothetical protein